MNEEIMGFSSQRFYEGQLIADASVATHRLADLEHVESSELTTQAVQFIDTAGAGWDEELEPDGESKRNPNEADLVLKYVGRLSEAGVKPSEMAVIAPYAAQVRLLRSRLLEQIDSGQSPLNRGGLSKLEIDTVDGFQGREKEAIVISLVRSNGKNEIGFLADTRRMNVALTRARRKLIVIGDSATIGSNEFYRSFLDYADSIEAYDTVWNEM